MGMDLELVPVPQKPRLHKRISAVIEQRIRETYRYDTTLWRTALAGLWTLSFLTFSATILGMPTGLGIPADIALAAVVGTIILAAAGHLIALLIALTGLRIPRLFAGCLLSDLFIVWLVLYGANMDWVASTVIAVLCTALGALSGIALGLLRNKRVAAGLLLTSALMLSQLALAGGGQNKPGDPGADAISDSIVKPLAASNPAEPGPYAYDSFTYASGNDLHRKEYRSDAALLSSPVDASAYIQKGWPKLRSLFWGFDYRALPLNGRVWMPEGEGSHPLVLIVHGNHMMEDYSDGGYAYLGELLASRGFIAVSLDENFLNYSAWTGIPDNDFTVRAWLILKHMEQLAAFSDQPGNPFYGKIDFSKTALMGHSRGGQAVAMAADSGRWFKDDPVWKTVTDRFQISSVVALAPTDKAIDGQQAKLKDISYLTLQGARDGDVHDFYGDRQYIRSSYSEGSAAFKSSLYIADANHSQFNSDWGLRDQSLPTGLFLDRSLIMDGAEQRQITKVYVSAFLETTLLGKDEYRGMFRDYRSGLQWLPDTAYYSRFQGGDYRTLVNFDEDRNKYTAGIGTASAQGMTWTEELAKDREDKSKTTYGVVLKRTAEKGEEAYYRVKWKEEDAAPLDLSEAEGLSFSLANRNADDDEEENEESSLAPEVEVELTDSNDTSARLPLSEIMDVLPLPHTQFTLLPWLEERVSDGKYGDPTEAVFQTYELPFERFQEVEPALEPENLTEITFYLEEKGDKIMLDDIGFYGGSTENVR
ncbi:alpha/beta hydrolase [Paenibacillus sp. NPDC056722]|uniref:poly(ethylene terephthalate) hydrolase family protein n=1 Tax=Paenibacillus sp. NPDC056722 TaxID=3345924 RepID=UPI00369618A1